MRKGESMTAEVIDNMITFSERIIRADDIVDNVKCEICDKCKFTCDSSITQENMDVKCKNCIVELIKGFVF